jgi:hypothetical protein
VSGVRGEVGLSRRSFLSRAARIGAAAGLASPLDLISTPSARARACISPVFRNSLSVSPFTEQVLGAGVALTDGVHVAKTVQEVQRLYNLRGATEVYARIGTLKVNGDNNAGNAESGWARGLDRARLARELGLPFNPELGLFAAYGDAATYQEPPDFSDYPSIRLPGRWTDLTIEQMLPQMREYGALVARQVLSTGVRVDYWDIGNEVENGIAGVTVIPLFPDNRYKAPDNVDPQIGLMSVPTLVAMPDPERIAWCQAHLWPYVGKLLAAAAEGIRSVHPSARFSTHISGFGHKTPAVQLAFWQAVKDVGYFPDLFGTSYYPTSGKSTDGAIDTVAFIKGVAAGVRQKFGRHLFIAEYGYPSALMPPPYPFNDTVSGYPQTPQGQHDFTRDLVIWGITEGWLSGLRPWAPDYCTNSAWAPMAWFTQSGVTATPKPAFAAVEEALEKLGLCSAVTSGRLELDLRGIRRGGRDVQLALRMSAGSISGLTIELRRGRHLIARTRARGVASRWHEVVLHPRRRLPAGRYTLLVLHEQRILIRKPARVAKHGTRLRLVQRTLAGSR